MLLSLLLLPVAASAATDAATLAKAKALLVSADEKLAQASSIHATYTESDEYTSDYKDLRQTGEISLAKPGSVNLAISRARRIRAGEPWKTTGNDTLSVSDGTLSYSVFFHPNSTQVRKSQASALKLEQVPLLSGFAGEGLAGEIDKASSADVEGSTVKYKVGSIERTAEVGSDGLVHRLVVHNEKLGFTKTWTLDTILLNPSLTASTFSYSTPKDALPFPAPEKSEGIAIGALAPDFEVLLSSGKVAHLSDLKGKVVVLEFWATWCWPCNQSMPETQRLLHTYGEKGVEGLLVSIKDSRKGFDSWVKGHPQYRDLAFAFDNPVNGKAYEAFAHPGNPTLYVIGRDGKVVAKFEGYAGPNPAVEAAIKAAL